MTRRSWHILAALALGVVALRPDRPAASQPAGPPGGAPAPVAVVRLPFPQEDGTLTPYTFELGYPLMTLVYDTLLWRDAEGVPQPWLARSVETSPNGRKVTIRLAEGARWHDGAPVTSADVAFTFAYVAAHPHPRFSGEVAAVERVDTPDAATAVVTLRQPAPGFADQPLADLPIIPKHLWEGLARSTSAPDGLPVGSGPYRLVEHVPGQRYRFEATPGYFRGPPAVTTIEVPIITAVDETVRALQRGQVDMVPVNLPEGLKEQVDTLSIRVDEGPSYLGTVVMFNVRSPPFDSVDVRRAVAGAIDLGRISRAVGNAVAADHGYLHPQSPFASAEALHSFEPGAARPVLRTTGVPITLLAPSNDPAKAEAGRRVVQALRDAGATAELKLVTRDELGHAVGEDGSPPSFQVAVWTSPPLASYDPTFLGRLFGSDNATAPLNFSGYRSPAFDEVARRVATTTEPAARKAAVAEALALLAADVPVVPLYFAGGAFAYRPAVYDGWTFVKGSGILDKRSFVARKVAPAPGPPGTGAPEAEAEAGGEKGSLVGRIAVGAVATAMLLALVALASGRRERRRVRRR